MGPHLQEQAIRTEVFPFVLFFVSDLGCSLAHYPSCSRSGTARGKSAKEQWLMRGSCTALRHARYAPLIDGDGSCVAYVLVARAHVNNVAQLSRSKEASLPTRVFLGGTTVCALGGLVVWVTATVVTCICTYSFVALTRHRTNHGTVQC